MRCLTKGALNPNRCTSLDDLLVMSALKENKQGSAAQATTAKKQPSVVHVASRYAASKPAAGGGLPSVRSQMERAKAEAVEMAKAADEAIAGASAASKLVAVLKSCARSALADADAEMASTHNLLREANAEVALLTPQLRAARQEASEQRDRADTLERHARTQSEQVSRLEAQLREAHAGLAEARDVQLPSAVRDAETARARHERQVAENMRLKGILEARSQSLREACGHFETLQRALAPEDDGLSMDGLAQRALASFGTVYAERGLHKADPRFDALQDDLVRLCMLAGRLGSWAPWWSAQRHAETSAIASEADAQDAETSRGERRGCAANGECAAEASDVALSPEELALSPELGAGSDADAGSGRHRALLSID